MLIAVGLLMFGFVAYQLWGTGLEYAQAQDRLDDEFEQLLAGAADADDDDDRRTDDDHRRPTPRAIDAGDRPCTGAHDDRRPPPAPTGAGVRRRAT